MSHWLKSIPLIWVTVFTIIGFLALAVWVWLQPTGYVFEGAPDKKKWRDLRLWATVMIVVEAIVYIIFR